MSRLRTLARWAGAAVVAGSVVSLARRRKVAHVRVRFDLGHRVQRGPAPGEVRLSVIVPAYGEADRIGDTVRLLRKELEPVAAGGGLEIIVVDDGSSDGTGFVAESAGADRVIVHGVNRGKGAAVRSGVLAARGRTVAFTDADLSYSPDHLIELLEQVEAGWDVVVGSRRHDDTTTLVKARRLREIGGRAINLLTRVVLLGRYRDTQCGVKAFRSDLAQLIFGHSHVDGFAFDVEVFHLVEAYHLSLSEVPVRVQNSTRSTVHVVRDAAVMVRDVFAVRRWSAQGRYDLDPHEVALVARSGSD
ncbi:MAG TPA: glycosyltransferase [Acidimicrobiales bacterium]|nr:glycosyltransferase [Acidimicrobiales bacterium]